VGHGSDRKTPVASPEFLLVSHLALPALQFRGWTGDVFANTGGTYLKSCRQSSLQIRVCIRRSTNMAVLNLANRTKSTTKQSALPWKGRTLETVPIVQLDHEEILIREHIRVMQEIAPCFCGFMRLAVSEKLQVV
jgi:hypothetical protein